jgi:uncharacterized protein
VTRDFFVMTRNIVAMNTRDSTPASGPSMRARQPDDLRPQVMHHRWESLLFLHWRVPPAQIQSTLPAGLAVDTFAGGAYLGLTSFFMRQVRLVGLPALPWISNFQELNVRTYVYDRAGVPGIWFYSLDCNQPLAVAGARVITGLPYQHAEMKATTNGYIHYSCRRRGVQNTARYRYRGAGQTRPPAEPGSLEFFLLERYYLYALRHKSLIRAQVSHQPYRARAADAPAISGLPARLDGFADISDAAEHLCYIDGLEVKVFAPYKCGRAAEGGKFVKSSGRSS